MVVLDTNRTSLIPIATSGTMWTKLPSRSRILDPKFWFLLIGGGDMAGLDGEGPTGAGVIRAMAGFMADGAGESVNFGGVRL